MCELDVKGKCSSQIKQKRVKVQLLLKWCYWLWVSCNSLYSLPVCNVWGFEEHMIWKFKNSWQHNFKLDCASYVYSLFLKFNSEKKISETVVWLSYIWQTYLSFLVKILVFIHTHIRRQLTRAFHVLPLYISSPIFMVTYLTRILCNSKE